MDNPIGRLFRRLSGKETHGDYMRRTSSSQPVATRNTTQPATTTPVAAVPTQERGDHVSHTTQTGSHKTAKKDSSNWKLPLVALLAILLLLALWLGIRSLLNPTSDTTPAPPVTTSAPATPSTTPPPSEDETSEPAAEPTPANEGTNGTRVTEDQNVRDLLERNGYRTADGWTTDVGERAWDDLADNAPGALVVDDTFPVNAREAAESYKNNPTVGGTFDQKANPGNWVFVYNPNCVTYDDMMYRNPNGTFGSGAGFVECGTGAWVNVAVLRDGVAYSAARVSCDNGFEGAPRLTDEQPSFPEIKPIEKLAAAGATPAPKKGEVKTVKQEVPAAAPAPSTPATPAPAKVVEKKTIITVVKDCVCKIVPIIPCEETPAPEKPQPTPSAPPTGQVPPTPSEEPSKPAPTTPAPTTPAPTTPTPTTPAPTTPAPTEAPKMVEVCLNKETGETGEVPESEVGNYPSVEDCKKEETPEQPNPEPSVPAEPEPSIPAEPEPSVPAEPCVPGPKGGNTCEPEQPEIPVKVCLNKETGEIGEVPSDQLTNYPSVENCKKEETPEQPEVPETPEVPEQPETPEQPNPEPSVPAEPENPEPSVPAEPEPSGNPKSGDDDLIKDDGLNPAPTPDSAQGEETPEQVLPPIVPLDPEVAPGTNIPVGDTPEETVIGSDQGENVAGPVMDEANGNVNPDFGQVGRDEQNADPGTVTAADPVVDPVTDVVIVQPGESVIPPVEAPAVEVIADPDGTVWTGQPITTEPAPVTEVAAAPVVAVPVTTDPIPAPVDLAPAAPVVAEVPPAPVAVDMTGGEDVPPTADVDPSFAQGSDVLVG